MSFFKFDKKPTIHKGLRTHGMLSEKEMMFLAENAIKYQNILEIGSYMGKSTIILLENTSGHVHTIDPFIGEPRDINKNVEIITNYYRNLQKYIVNGKLITFIGYSNDIFNVINKDIKFDMIFIDGNHLYEFIKNDIVNSLSFLKTGGLLCGHDYTNSKCPGVKKAVDESFPKIKLIDMIWSPVD